jgi:hypothetical protein
MSEFVDVLLKLAGALGLGAAAIVGLLKWIVPHFLAKELQRHKADLDRQLEEFKIRAQAEYEGTLDRARHEMARQALERQVRFSRLHEQRAEVISGTYARLDRFHRSVRSMMQLVSTSQPRPEGWDAALGDYRELAKYWYEKAIWLDEETNVLIRPIVDLLMDPINSLAVTKDRNFDDLRDAVDRARAIVDEQVPAARQSMERHMRRILEGHLPSDGATNLLEGYQGHKK